MKQVQSALSMRVFFFPSDDPHEAQNVVSHATQNRPPTSYGSGLLEFSLLNSLQLLTGLNNAKCF